MGSGDVVGRIEWGSSVVGGVEWGSGVYECGSGVYKCGSGGVVHGVEWGI